MGESQKIMAVRSARQVPVRVRLLDDDVFNHSVDKRALGWILFDKVCEHLNILEKDYFGLNYTNPAGEKYWLNNDKKIAKQLKGQNWDFNFEVKFYPADPSQLAEDLTRYQLCLQIRRDIVNERLPCSFVTYTMLGSYTAQSELGDYDTEEFGSGYKYLKDIQFAPHQDKELLIKIAEIHRQHKGQTPEESELHYLENAKKLAMYGVELHPAKDAEGKDIQLGVGASGLIVYKDKVQINRFVWPKVLKISYRRNKYYIKIRPGEFEEFASLIGFKLLNVKYAKRLWKISVEHHSFFRFREPEPPKHASLLPRFGSRFRYSGRTAFQTRQIVAEEARDSPYFDRVLSKRGTFAGRTQNMRKRDDDRQQRRDDMRRQAPPLPQTKIPPLDTSHDDDRPSPRQGPPEPKHAPPIAPKPATKPKPLPRGSRESLDKLAESLNDSFEDVPDRRSRMEKMHAVPTPLAAVMQKSMEMEKKKHQEDADRRSEDRYSEDRVHPDDYDDQHHREVGRYSQIKDTNQAFRDSKNGAFGKRDSSYNPYAQISDVPHEHFEVFDTNTSTVPVHSDKYLFSYPSSSIDSILSHDDYTVDDQDSGAIGTKLHASEHDLTGYSDKSHGRKRNKHVSHSRSVGALHTKQDLGHYEEIPFDLPTKHLEGIYQDIDEVKKEIEPLRDKHNDFEGHYSEIPARLIKKSFDSPQKIYGRRSKSFRENQTSEASVVKSVEIPGQDTPKTKSILKTKKPEEPSKTDVTFARKLFGRTSVFFKSKQKPKVSQSIKNDSHEDTNLLKQKQVVESPVTKINVEDLNPSNQEMLDTKPSPQMPLYATINKDNKTIIKPKEQPLPKIQNQDNNHEASQPNLEHAQANIYSKPIKSKPEKVSENVPNLREEFKMYLLDPEKSTSPREFQQMSSPPVGEGDRSVTSESRSKSSNDCQGQNYQTGFHTETHVEITPTEGKLENPESCTVSNLSDQNGSKPLSESKSSIKTTASSQSRGLDIIAYDMEPGYYERNKYRSTDKFDQGQINFVQVSDTRERTNISNEHFENEMPSLKATIQRHQDDHDFEQNLPCSALPIDKTESSDSDKEGERIRNLGSSSLSSLYKLDFGSSINSSIMPDQADVEDMVQLLEVEDHELERFSNLSSGSSDLDLRYVSFRSEDMNNAEDIDNSDLDLERFSTLSTDSGEFESKDVSSGKQSFRANLSVPVRVKHRKRRQGPDRMSLKGKKKDVTHFDRNTTDVQAANTGKWIMDGIQTKSAVEQKVDDDGKNAILSLMKEGETGLWNVETKLDNMEEESHLSDKQNIQSSQSNYEVDGDDMDKNSTVNSINIIESSIAQMKVNPETSDLAQKSNHHVESFVINVYDQEPFSRSRPRREIHVETAKEERSTNIPTDEFTMDFFTKPQFYEEFRNNSTKSEPVSEPGQILDSFDGNVKDSEHNENVVDSQIKDAKHFEGPVYLRDVHDDMKTFENKSPGSKNTNLMETGNEKELIRSDETPVKSEQLTCKSVEEHLPRRKLDFSWVTTTRETKINDRQAEDGTKHVLPMSKVYPGEVDNSMHFNPEEFYKSSPREKSEAADKLDDSIILPSETSESQIISGNLSTKKINATDKDSFTDNKEVIRQKSSLPLIASKNLTEVFQLNPSENRAPVVKKIDKGSPGRKMVREDPSKKSLSGSNPVKGNVTKQLYERKVLSQSPDSSFSSVTSLDTSKPQKPERNRSGKAIKPGVIHMLNPCPSGWIEGGIKTSEKNKTSDKTNKCKLEKSKKPSPKFTVSVLDFEPGKPNERSSNVSSDSHMVSQLDNDILEIGPLDINKDGQEKPVHEHLNNSVELLPKADLLCKRIWTYPKGKKSASSQRTDDAIDDSDDDNASKDEFDAEIRKGPWDVKENNENITSQHEADDATQTHTESNSNMESVSSNAANHQAQTESQNNLKAASYIQNLSDNSSLTSRLQTLGLGNVNIDENEVNALMLEMQTVEFVDSEKSLSDSEPSETDSDSSDEVELASFEMPSCYSFQYDKDSSFDMYDNVGHVNEQFAIDCSFEDVTTYKTTYKMNENTEQADSAILCECNFPDFYRDKIPRTGKKAFKVPVIIDETPFKGSRSNLKSRAKSDSSLERRVRFQENLPVYKSVQNINGSSNKTDTKNKIPFIDTNEVEKMKRLEDFITCLFEKEPQKLGRNLHTEHKEKELTDSKPDDKVVSDKVKHIAKIEAEIQALSKLEKEVDEWRSGGREAVPDLEFTEQRGFTVNQQTPQENVESESDEDCAHTQELSGNTVCNKKENEDRNNIPVPQNSRIEKQYIDDKSIEDKEMIDVHDTDGGDDDDDDDDSDDQDNSGQHEKGAFISQCVAELKNSKPFEKSSAKTVGCTGTSAVCVHDFPQHDSDLDELSSAKDTSSESDPLDMHACITDIRDSETKSSNKELDIHKPNIGASHEMKLTENKEVYSSSIPEGKVTRYSFTVNDDSDNESPTIKTVTYEYVTEYKLNNVKVHYQQNRKTQTDDPVDQFVSLPSIKQKPKSNTNDFKETHDSDVIERKTEIIVEEVTEKSVCYPLGPIHGASSSFHDMPKYYTDSDVEEEVDKMVTIVPKPIACKGGNLDRTKDKVVAIVPKPIKSKADNLERNSEKEKSHEKHETMHASKPDSASTEPDKEDTKDGNKMKIDSNSQLQESEQTPIVEEPIEKSVYHELQAQRPKRHIWAKTNEKHFVEHDSKKYVWRSLITSIPFKNIAPSSRDINDEQNARVVGDDCSEENVTTVNRDESSNIPIDELVHRNNKPRIVSEDALEIEAEPLKDCSGNASIDSLKDTRMNIPEIRLNGMEEPDIDHSTQKGRIHTYKRTPSLKSTTKHETERKNAKDNTNGGVMIGNSDYRHTDEFLIKKNKTTISNCDDNSGNELTYSEVKEEPNSSFEDGNESTHTSENMDTKLRKSREDIYSTVMQERLPAVIVESQTEDQVFVMQAMAIIGLGAVLVFLLPYV